MTLGWGVETSFFVALGGEIDVDSGDAFGDEIEELFDECIDAVFFFSPIHTTLCG
jgi:hypothetical protein